LSAAAGGRGGEEELLLTHLIFTNGTLVLSLSQLATERRGQNEEITKEGKDGFELFRHGVNRPALAAMEESTRVPIVSGDLEVHAVVTNTCGTIIISHHRRAMVGYRRWIDFDG
jgi:hypothetical protein